MKWRWNEILSRISDNAIGAEIGVWEGCNADELLNGSSTLWLCCVDQWLANDKEYIRSGDGKSKIKQSDFDRAKQITYQKLFKYGDRYMVIEMESAKASNLFRDKFFDFVFIDANHAYGHVKQDICAWLPKIKSGGWIGGHDYKVYPGVRKAVNEIFPADRIELGVDHTWFVKI